MVCEKCTSKLNKLATIHKSGPSPSATSSSSTKKHVSNENKLLTMKSRFKAEKTEFKKCRICKRMCHHISAHYCQDCAYQKGICAMCGRKIVEESALREYRQSLT